MMDSTNLKNFLEYGGAQRIQWLELVEMEADYSSLVCRLAPPVKFNQVGEKPVDEDLPYVDYQLRYMSDVGHIEETLEEAPLEHRYASNALLADHRGLNRAQTFLVLSILDAAKYAIIKLKRQFSCRRDDVVRERERPVPEQRVSISSWPNSATTSMCAHTGSTMMSSQVPVSVLISAPIPFFPLS